MRAGVSVSAAHLRWNSEKKSSTLQILWFVWVTAPAMWEFPGFGRTPKKQSEVWDVEHPRCAALLEALALALVRNEKLLGGSDTQQLGSGRWRCSRK